MPTAIITGAGKRIGRGLALGFARRGWDIVVHYNTSREGARQTMQEIESMGRRAIMISADLRDFKSIRKTFEEATEQLGHPDLLINNAGVFPARTSIRDADLSMWDDTLNINTRAHYYTSKLFAKIAGRNGRIINIASLGGLEVWKQRIPYNVSKAAAIHLTKALARELAPEISVNTICPGIIIVPDQMYEHDTRIIDEDRIPMGRYGNIDDIMDAAWFFATASQYITAQILTVDGGYHDAR